MQSYKNNELYIFISYSHKDKDVRTIIGRLKGMNYRLWYDDSIEGGSKWNDVIADNIKNCHVFWAFISNNYISSRYCRDELDYALNEDKNVQAIFIEDVVLSEGLKLSLGRIQALFRKNYENENAFFEKLCRSDNIEKCIDDSRIKPASWGPQDRRTFTRNNLPDYATFNSVIDDQSIGDQRNFVRIRKKDGDEKFKDQVQAEIGEVYEVIIYFENNAKTEKNESGEGIARSVCVRVNYPNYIKGGHIAAICGEISSENSEPNNVYDHAFLKNDTGVDLYLNYVKNSTFLNCKGSANGAQINGEALHSDGVSLAYWDDMWGMIPAGEEYAGYLTYSLKVDKILFSIRSEVSIDGEEWNKTISSSPGDVVCFKLTLINTGTTELTSVTAHDDLSKSLEYIEGSSFAWSTRHPEGSKSPDVINKDGLGLGAIIPNEEAVVLYKARISDSVKKGKTIYNRAYFATTDGKREDMVRIIVK